MASQRLESANLQHTPYRLSYRRYTDHHYSGYYHCHQGVEILYIRQGVGHIAVNRRISPVSPGMLVFFQPYQLHRVHMDVSPESPYERTIISFEPLAFRRHFDAFPHLGAYFQQLCHGELGAQFLSDADPDGWLDELCRRFHDRLPLLGEADRLSEFGLFAVQLAHALQQLGLGGSLSRADGPPAPRQTRHSEEAMNWLEERFRQTVRLEEMARELHLSKPYLSRVFRQETGSSITEYIAARRIREACRLLVHSEMTVERVGVEVGIDNFSYFCQLFKKTMGVSPNRFRSDARYPHYM